MKPDNIQALRDAIAGLRKAEAEFDNYINTTRATDPDAEEMTIQLMGLIITFGEILLPKVVYRCYRNRCITVTNI